MEADNQSPGGQVLKEWIIGRLGGQWSDIPDAVLLALGDRPALAVQVLLVQAITDLIAEIQPKVLYKAWSGHPAFKEPPADSD